MPAPLLSHFVMATPVFLLCISSTTPPLFDTSKDVKFLHCSGASATALAPSARSWLPARLKEVIGAPTPLPPSSSPPLVAFDDGVPDPKLKPPTPLPPSPPLVAFDGGVTDPKLEPPKPLLSSS